MTISELAERAGLSTYTLRFYEKAGVLSPTPRATNGHRRYLDADVRWLAFVMRLKATGMPLAEIKRYAQLRAQGDGTVAPRLDMLLEHRETLVRKLQELQDNMAALDDKVTIYQAMLQQAPSVPKRTEKPTRKSAKA
ncbi:MerR family transcriptional regulator [Rhodoferax aquaticus]|uniref:MerR family transcriptional regulator n=1 Tax=Rhodoferax aquaticus TaxID=2527691 RepID=A0A515EVH6_9BURK|nr:MerR family transcriptional regulator [Rhodoferax aquaticus]